MWSFPITCRFPGFRRARHPRQPGGDHRRQPAQVQQGGDPQGRDAVGGRRRLPRRRHQVALPPGSVRSFFPLLILLIFFIKCASVWYRTSNIVYSFGGLSADGSNKQRVYRYWSKKHTLFFFKGIIKFFCVNIRFDRLADSWTPMPDMLYPGGIEVKRQLLGIRFFCRFYGKK